MPSRVYKSGSKWAVWRWAESPLLYMKRLHLVHTPAGGVMLNFISKPDPWPDVHDHPANFISFILRGKYRELRREKVGGVAWMSKHVMRTLCRPNIMRASPNVAHTIIATDPRTVTLVFYGPRLREWGYHTPDGWVHWKAYQHYAGTKGGTVTLSS